MTSFTMDNGRTYHIDHAYVFNGQIRIQTHFNDNGQGIGKTWLLSDLPAISAPKTVDAAVFAVRSV